MLRALAPLRAPCLLSAIRVGRRIWHLLLLLWYLWKTKGNCRDYDCREEENFNDYDYYQESVVNLLSLTWQSRRSWCCRLLLLLFLIGSLPKSGFVVKIGRVKGSVGYRHGIERAVTLKKLPIYVNHSHVGKIRERSTDIQVIDYDH